MSSNRKDLVQITRDYYNSREADEFYFHIWGGEDIHIGIYDPPQISIKAASRATVKAMEALLPSLKADYQILDIGAGYGGPARYLAGKHGARVDCLNLSETENERNRHLSRLAGLEKLIYIHTGNFEEIPFEANRHDVVWSQDAILHSDKKEQVFREVFRVLKPGGYFVFTDPMQSDECPDGVLQPVLDRIHLREMGSVKRYREYLRQIGFEEITVREMPEQLVHHYARILEEVKKNYENIVEKSGREYIEKMMAGLGHWIEAGKNAYLNWGIFLFKKPE
jgi:ubiquinone/menaquinone biosynthesis C-methylase UbiE